jgi:eukaryotic-like serine/threonine-protein kinase
MLAIGSLLQNGKYRIDGVLSNGGFGVTYRATLCSLSQSIILKTLKSLTLDGVETDVLVERFLKEARCLAQVEHPHVVNVSECFVEDEHPFIAMEWIEGQTLEQKIAPRPLPEAEALKYTNQVGQALTFLHQQGLIHREVKPSNIIVRPETKDAVLVDLGVAREFSPDETQIQTGTLAAGFSPLEQYLPNFQGTAATDVYGLAATLYALTTGHAPTASVLRNRIPLRDPRQLNPELSHPVAQAILAGMALNSTDRPQTVEAWLDLLSRPASSDGSTGQPNQALTDTDISAPEHTPPNEPQMPKSKTQTAQHISPPKSLGKSIKKSSAPKSASSPFPKRALLWSAAIAGLSGAGFGLYLRTQLFSTTPLSVQSPTPIPQETIEEAFPPKERPKVYSNDAPNLSTPNSDPNLSTPSTVPESLEPRQTPPADAPLQSNDLAPLSPPSDANPDNILAPPPDKPATAPKPKTAPQIQPKTNNFPDNSLAPNTDSATDLPTIEGGAQSLPTEKSLPQDPQEPPLLPAVP